MDDPHDSMGHRRGVADKISADDPDFPQPAGFYGTDGHYHLTEHNSFHLSTAAAQKSAPKFQSTHSLHQRRVHTAHTVAAVVRSSLQRVANLIIHMSRITTLSGLAQSIR